MSIRLSRRSVAALLLSLALGLPAEASASGFQPLPVHRNVESMPAAPRAVTTGPIAGPSTLKPKNAPEPPNTNSANPPPPPPQSKAGPGGAGMMIDPNG